MNTVAAIIAITIIISATTVLLWQGKVVMDVSAFYQQLHAATTVFQLIENDTGCKMIVVLFLRKAAH